MKQLLFVFLIACLPTIVFGQFDSKSLVGSWQYSDIVDLKGEPVDSAIQDFTLEIYEAGDFKITAPDYVIVGNWSLQDSTLSLDGERSDKVNRRLDSFMVKELNESELKFVVDYRVDQQALLTLKRKG